MLHSLELLPDAAGDAVVRRDWQLLREAKLPSMLDHQGSSNAPHVTAIAVPSLDASARDLAADLLGPLLPVECALTGLVVLGERRSVVARLVEAPDRLVEAVLRLKAVTAGHPFPGWLPHATLAHGLDRAQLARVVEIADPRSTPFVLASLRSWDPVSGTTATLVG